MISAVKKFGNSAGILIPKPLLSEFGVEMGDPVDMKIEGGRIVIERIAENPRKGWADDAKALAREGDDAGVWPEFANDEDDRLTW